MTNNKILYGLAIVAGAAIALWAGLPPIWLLFLACPVMMMFMMGGMGGMHGDPDKRGPSSGEDNNAPNPPRPTHIDGSHDRI
ncbi:MAG: DUF2933 domain-containing protein [Marmoricola sp.]